MTPKKFLDQNGLAYFARKLNNYPTNDVIEAVIDGVQDGLDEKVDKTSVGANNGVASLDSLGKVPLSQLNIMTGATASTDGTAGLVPAPTTLEVYGFLCADGTWKECSKPMVILSYGHSAWQDFLSAYQSNNIVYCRASSNSNPATGSQTRMAFMAYVNNEDNPTEVEFQYYRSVNGHNITQQGDQIYVYKLTNKGTWTVTVRECYTRIVAGDNLSGVWSNGVLTLHATDTIYDNATTTEAGLMSSTDKEKLDGIENGATANIGTITGITMNGVSKGTSGVVDLGSVITSMTASDIISALGYTPINLALKGADNGVAELDSTGKVPASQLPSFVDDVEEYDTRSEFPLVGESGKVYIDKSDNKTYRWSGSTYTVIGSDLALGETSSTAYRGDRGKVAYNHAVAKGNAFTSGLYKISTNSEGHVATAVAVTKSDITDLGIPGSDTTYEAISNEQIDLLFA